MAQYNQKDLTYCRKCRIDIPLNNNKCPICGKLKNKNKKDKFKFKGK